MSPPGGRRRPRIWHSLVRRDGPPPSRSMMNSPHTQSLSRAHLRARGGSEETRDVSADTQRSSIGTGDGRGPREPGACTGGVDVSGKEGGCAREVRGWGCGGRVEGWAGSGARKGGNAGAERGTPENARRRSGVRCGAAADGDAEGSGRHVATTTEESRGRSRAPVQGRRRALGLCAGRARRRGRVPPRSAALTGRERTSTGRSSARVSAVEQRV